MMETNNPQHERALGLSMAIEEWSTFCRQCGDSSAKQEIVAFDAWRDTWVGRADFATSDKAMKEHAHHERRLTEANAAIAIVLSVRATKLHELAAFLRARGEEGRSTFGEPNRERRRSRAHVDGDWRAFMSFLGLYAGHVPDNGSVLCALHAAIDHEAGADPTTYYS